MVLWKQEQSGGGRETAGKKPKEDRSGAARSLKKLFGIKWMKWLARFTFLPIQIAAIYIFYVFRRLNIIICLYRTFIIGVSFFHSFIRYATVWVNIEHNEAVASGTVLLWALQRQRICKKLCFRSNGVASRIMVPPSNSWCLPPNLSASRKTKKKITIYDYF